MATQAKNLFPTVSPTRQRLGLLTAGTLVGAGGLLAVLGPLGIVIALLVGAVSWWRSGLLGIVLLHAGALLSAGLPPLWTIALLETAAILLLVAEFRTLQHLGAILTLSGVVALGGAVALGLTQSNGITTAAVTIAASGGLLIYAVHRYEKFQLGLLGDTNES